MTQIKYSSFEQSKKLWDLGFRPERFMEPPFVWSQNKNCQGLIIDSHVSQKPQIYCDCNFKEKIWNEYPAYIITDVIEYLPWMIDIEINGKTNWFMLEIIVGEENFIVGYFNTYEHLDLITFSDEHLTLPIIDLFIWVIENKHVDLNCIEK